MSIIDLKPGENGYVKNIIGDERLTRRLLALGCIEGTRVTLKTKAPLGDPIIINVRGFDLAIRKKDAFSIKLKEA